MSNDESENEHHYQTPEEKWSHDIDIILNNLRLNCITMSEYHRMQYFQLQKKLKYFRIPVILLSSFSGFFNFGLQPYLNQDSIALICSIMSLFVGLLGSVELYLQLQKRMENELDNSKQYYLNAIDIYKVIKLELRNRNGDGKTYLEERYSIYRKLIESSNLVLENSTLSDSLIPMDDIVMKNVSPTVNKNNIVDKFDIFCNLVENSEGDFNNLIPLLVKNSKKSGKPIDQRKITLYSNLVNALSDIDVNLLNEIKPIILEDIQNNEDFIKGRFTLYNKIIKYKEKIPCELIENLKNILISDLETISTNTVKTKKELKKDIKKDSFLSNFFQQIQSLTPKTSDLEANKNSFASFNREQSLSSPNITV